MKWILWALLPFVQFVPTGYTHLTASSLPALVNFSGMPSTETGALGTNSGSGSGNCPTDTYCAPVTDPSLASNTIVVVYRYKPASGNTANTPTITSYTGGPNAGYTATSDTYTHCGTDANDGTHDYYIGCYYKVGATTGTSMIHAIWTTAATHVAVAVYQLYNVTAADGYNSGVSTSAVTSWSTGSVTSTQNNDLYLSCALGTTTINGVSAFTPGSGFTADLNDVRDAQICQEEVQSSSGALNPAITAGTSNSYAGITLALKSGSQGTAPSGMYIAHIYHVSSAAGISTSPVYDVPSIGNLQAVTTSGGTLTITAVSDSTNGSWTSCVYPGALGSNDGAISGYYKANATSGDLVVTLTHSGTGDVGPAVFYDIVGAATTQKCTWSGVQIPVGSTTTGSTFTSSSTVTSGTNNGIVLASAAVEDNTLLGASTPSGGSQDCSTAGGQSLNGPSYPDQNNGCSHWTTSGNTATAVTWNNLSTTTAIQYYGAGTMGFQAPSATTYPAIVQYAVNHATSSGTTVAVSSFKAMNAGDTLVVFVEALNSSGTYSVSDGTNTYTAIDGPTNGGSGPWRLASFYAKNISSSTVTITGTAGATNTQRSIFVVEVASTSTTAPFDTSSGVTAVTTNASNLAELGVTTGNANESVIGVVLCTNTCDGTLGGTAGAVAPFSQTGAADSFGDIVLHLNVSATGTYTAEAYDTAATGSSDLMDVVAVH